MATEWKRYHTILMVSFCFMYINGVEARRVELSPEEVIQRTLAMAAGQLAVFGAERLSHTEGNTAPPGLVYELGWEVEQLCTGMGS